MVGRHKTVAVALAVAAMATLAAQTAKSGRTNRLIEHLPLVV
jgi:hypothetical protein